MASPSALVRRRLNESMQNGKDDSPLHDAEKATSTAFFDDGVRVDALMLRVNSAILIASSVSLILLAIATRWAGCRWWLYPFLASMAAWRITVTMLSLRSVDAHMLSLSMLIPFDSTLYQMVVMLVAVFTCACCCRVGRFVHAGLIALYDALTGLCIESTNQHWWLMLACSATGHDDLVEASLALVHLLCGLQKLNSKFWARFPEFIVRETARVTGTAIPFAFAGMATVCAPLIELGGGALVLASLACGGRAQCCKMAFYAGALGNALLLGYHAAVNLLLYGSNDIGVYSYNLACAAVALEALVARAATSELRGSDTSSSTTSATATATGGLPTAIPLMAFSSAAVAGARAPLVFGLGLCLAGLPLANAAFGDTFWGWHPSGGMQLYTWREPQIELCVGAAREQWPQDVLQYVTSLSTLSGVATCTDAAACEPGRPFSCLDESDWASQSQGQRHYDLSFALDAAAHFAASFARAHVGMGRPNITVRAMIPTRTSLEPTVIVCTEQLCPRGHAGGVVLAVVLATFFVVVWPHHVVRPSKAGRTPPHPLRRLRQSASCDSVSLSHTTADEPQEGLAEQSPTTRRGPSSQHKEYSRVPLGASAPANEAAL